MSQSTFVKSTIVLTIATLLSKVLGSVYRIPLQNIAGDEVLGIFSLVYPVYMVALYLSVAGIPLAISKLIAAANASGETWQVKKIYRTASILAICFGVLGFAVITGFSVPLAEALGGEVTRYALIVVAMTLLVAPYMAVYRGFFQGFGNMQPTAMSQVLEQLMRVIVILVMAVVLVRMDLTNDVVAGGVMIGSVVGALSSLIYLRVKYAKSTVKVVDQTAYAFSDFTSYSKAILKISIPIAIGSVTMALFNFVDSFTISYGLKAIGTSEEQISYLFGIYSRGTTLVQITTVFASSIILPLVPLITTKLTANDTEGTRAVIEQTNRMTHFISWPAAVGLFALTLPLNVALFTNLEGSWMLAMINLSAVFTSLTLLGTGVLQGMNAAKLAAYIILFGVVVKVFANIGLIHLYGLEGAAYATLLVYALIVVVNTGMIVRRIRFAVVTSSIMKMIVASGVMGAMIGVPTLYVDVAQWSRITSLLYVGVGIVVGAIVYFALLLAMRAISKQDLRRLPIIGKRFN